MKAVFKLRRLLDGTVGIIRWRKKGRKYESPSTMPSYVMEYLGAEQSPTNPNIYRILDDSLEDLAGYAATDGTLRAVVLSTLPGGAIAGMRLEAEIPDQKPRSWDGPAVGRFPEEKDALEALDAFGEMPYTIHFADSDQFDDFLDEEEYLFSEEGGEEARITYAFDFIVFTRGRRKFVAYEAVADNGGDVWTEDSGIVPVSQAPYDLPLHSGPPEGSIMTQEDQREAQRTNARWNADLKRRIKETKVRK